MDFLATAIGAVFFCGVGCFVVGFSVGARYGRWSAEEEHAGMYGRIHTARGTYRRETPRLRSNGDIDQDDEPSDRQSDCTSR